MGVLDGKVIVITGTAQGMGERHVQWCVAEGAQVIAADIQVEKGRAVAEALGDRAMFVEHDVTDGPSWDRLVQLVMDSFGRLDGLVNNAAIFSTSPLDEESFERFEEIQRTNVFGTWRGITSVVPAMRSAGGGSIVNISSTAGLRAYPSMSSYGCSKWAVRGLTKYAAQDLGKYRIRVNSVHPGGIKHTGMFSVPSTPEALEARGATIPLGRVGERDDISAMVGFLLSDGASYVTGVEHVVDGGSIL